MKHSGSTASLDMTQGSPFKLILTFSLPLLVGSALQQLYNMVDSVVVGQFVGHTALAAVGVAFPVVFLLSSLFMGLGMGATVVISQYFGAKSYEEMRRAIGTIYTALVVGGVPLSVLGVLCTNPILDLLSIPPDVREQAYAYLIIIMGGLLGTLGYNFNAGILQGLGDSRSPLLFLAISTVINIILDLVFVLVVDLGVSGVAIATIIAQTFSWIFGILFINKRYPEININPLSFKFDVTIFKQIVRIGLPAGIQQAVLSVSIILLNRLVNTFGSTFSAAFSATSKLETFIFLPFQSLSNALIAYTGQNMGAGNTERVKKGLRVALLMCYGFATVGLLLIPFGGYMMRMFTSDTAVIQAGMDFLVRVMPCYFLFATAFMPNATMRGAGQSFLPMVSVLLGLCIVRVPLAYMFAHWFGPANMYFAYGCGWAVALLIIVPAYFSGSWKKSGIVNSRKSTRTNTALK